MISAGEKGWRVVGSTELGIGAAVSLVGWIAPQDNGVDSNPIANGRDAAQRLREIKLGESKKSSTTIFLLEANERGVSEEQVCRSTIRTARMIKAAGAAGLLVGALLVVDGGTRLLSDDGRGLERFFTD